MRAKAKYDCKGFINQTCETYSTKQMMEKDLEYGILWLWKRVSLGPWKRELIKVGQERWEAK